MRKISDKTRLKQKRSEGKGSAFRPWQHPSEVPSTGVAHRIYGFKSKRQCNFHSNMEFDFFHYADFSDNVLDIREQFALKPLKETLTIASEKNIIHAQDESHEPVILTIDLLLKIKDGKRVRQLAIMVKPSSELKKKRVMEKFELAREFLDRRKIDLLIITERELNKTVVHNLKLLRASSVISRKLPTKRFLQFFKKLSQTHPASTLKSALTKAEKKFDIQEKDCVHILHYLMFKKLIAFDYNIHLKDSTTLNQLMFHESK
jgi:hypothetical protein